MLFSFFFFNDTATTEIYTLSLHDALPISILALMLLTGGPTASAIAAGGVLTYDASAGGAAVTGVNYDAAAASVESRSRPVPSGVATSGECSASSQREYDVSANSVATNEIRVATGLTTKSSAPQALGQLDLTAEQLAAANRAIGRATTSSSIDVVLRGSEVIVRISRPGADGFQVFEYIVSPDGVKSVLQLAYDSTGSLVHYDPKIP